MGSAWSSLRPGAPSEAVYDGPSVTPTEPAEITLAGGLNPYGTMGQGGNIAEWNETVVFTGRGVRGGAFTSNTASTLGVDIRVDVPPGYELDNRIGFRVTSIDTSFVPEPASAVLLSLFGCMLLKRRRLR